ncbi:hypothetical protein H1C71_014136, partial [Ictidomys tridecemlineatus]
MSFFCLSSSAGKPLHSAGLVAIACRRVSTLVFSYGFKARAFLSGCRQLNCGCPTEVVPATPLCSPSSRYKMRGKALHLSDPTVDLKESMSYCMRVGRPRPVSRKKASADME